MNKRDFLKIVGGGVVLAATPGCSVLSPTPSTAIQPWQDAGTLYSEPRKRALSYAILCPNPHNRQPWKVDLSVENQVTIYVDTNRLLPHTDPYARQITIGLGCFTELMVMAAAQDGWQVEVQEFPEGADATQPLDERPVVVATFSKSSDVIPDPLFAHTLTRRSNKDPYDTSRTVPDSALEVAMSAAKHGTVISGSNEQASISTLRTLTTEALLIEIETPRTYKESVDLFRIGKKEVEKNPDGIDFTGRMFELLSTFGLFSREAALDTDSTAFKSGKKSVLENTETAMAHVWLVTDGNTRIDQLNAGRDWMRMHLATTPTGVALQPLSQALQEYPEMNDHYEAVHGLLAPNGGTIQMLARMGFGEPIAPSPRWPLATRIKV